MPNSTFEIRPYAAHDADAVMNVWRSASEIAHGFLGQDFLRREGDAVRNQHLAAAEVSVLSMGGEIVGFIALVGKEIGGLFVDPAAHGNGLGRALVDHAASHHPELTVEVFAKNPVGPGFYRAYGFVETGRRRHAETGETLIEMSLG